MGRRTLYDPDRHPFLAARYAREGCIEEEIAKRFGVSRTTITTWKNKYPAFLAALKTNKEIVDYEVEDSLLKLAKGFEYEETEITVVVGPDGKETQKKRIKRTKRFIPPNVTAARSWLNNRMKHKWRHMPEPPLPDNEDKLAKLVEAMEAAARAAKSDI